MSDTPRTDAHCEEIGGDDGLCYADFARQLERELAAMQAERDEVIRKSVADALRRGEVDIS